MASVSDMLKDLEMHVDKFGVRAVICALGDICQLKAEHIRENWQDENLARVWEQLDGYLALAAEADSIKAVEHYHKPRSLRSVRNGK